MKKGLLLMAVIAFVYACGGSNAESDGGEVAAKTAAPKPDGEKIYKQYCVACHGLYGDMGASGAFDLTTSELPVAERVKVITNGRNVMTAFEALLEPEEIEAVAAYTLKLKKG